MKRPRGYTLVEIMIAIIIFTWCIILITALFPLSLRDTFKARVMTQAAFLGQAKMEEILSTPEAELQTITLTEGDFSPDFKEFSYRVNVTPFVYRDGGTTITSEALWDVKVEIYHDMNRRSRPIVEYSVLKAGIGEE